MKTLSIVAPTPEQLKIITTYKDGVMLLRGAAGSGKTTTALLRLRQVCAAGVRRKTRHGIGGHLKVLVITYNRTLRGYINEVASGPVAGDPNINLTIETFASWAKKMVPGCVILDTEQQHEIWKRLNSGLGVSDEFLTSEVEYVLGRFEKERLNDYLTCEREGRGTIPRCDRDLRKKILEKVIDPYENWKSKEGCSDWNDLAISVGNLPKIDFDIIIADEAQDLSANQARSLAKHAAETSSITFVLDTAQRIYPRGFTWKEAGIVVPPNMSHRLSTNHRNTKQICALAAPILEGLAFSDDATMPDLKSCTREGKLPNVILGKYSEQIAWSIIRIKDVVSKGETVAFLHSLGYSWFSATRGALKEAGIEFEELTRQKTWPTSSACVALSTMASAKGLEFDHVFILGLNAQTMRHGDDVDDTQHITNRKLLAMAITRARKTVTIGTKPSEQSNLIDLLDRNTYENVLL